MLSDFKIMFLTGFDMHEAGHLTLLGWTSFALYMVAALLAFRAAIASHRREPILLCRTWSAFAVVLLVLGFNKPFNLQTRLIELTRTAAHQENLMEHRRLIQMLFFLCVTLGIVLLILAISFRFPGQIKKVWGHIPMAASGCAIICIYVLIRAASINHVDQLVGLNLDRFPFWLLEMMGLLLISIQAVGETRLTS